MTEKKIDLKRIVYTISLLALCGVAFVRGVGDGDWWHLAINCIGLCLFPILVIRFDAKSFLKISYAIWLVITSPIAVFLIIKFYYSMTHRNAFAAMVIECVVYGLIFIRIIIGLIKKEFAGRLKEFNPLIIAVVLFFILASASVNKATWPIYLGIVFTCFYMAPSDAKERERLFVSLADALIISFFLIQSFAFLHRPYDQARYVGAYTNSNVNGMFYFAVYLGWLAKYTYLRKHEAKKFFIVVHFLFASAMWSFALLTISRSILMAFVAATVVYLLSSEIFILKNTFVKGFLLKGLLMFVVFAASFPLVFACVRYIPPLRHHPIWITEYSEDFVHSYDPWNSEKYIEINELFEVFTGRFDPDNVDEKDGFLKEQKLLDENRSTLQNVYTEYELRKSEADELLTMQLAQGENVPTMQLAQGENVPTMQLAENEESENIERFTYTDALISMYPMEESAGAADVINEKGKVIKYADGVAPGSDKNHPAYTFESYQGLEKILGIRKYIYGFFFGNLNLFGHEEEYPYVYLLPWYGVPHAHNSYLQIAYCFGIPAGLIFFGLSAFSCIYTFVYAVIKKKETPWFYAFICAAHLGIAMISLTENIAFPGKMLFSLFFLTLLPIMKKNAEDKQKTANDMPAEKEPRTETENNN